MCFWTAFIVFNLDLGLSSTAFVCFFVGENRQGTDTRGRTGFASERQERLLTHCDSSYFHRSLQTSSPRSAWPLLLSSTAGSFPITLCGACGVFTGESGLVTVYCGSSQHLVLHDLAVDSMSLALRLTISLDACRDFVQRLRMSIATISHFCALGRGVLQKFAVRRAVSMVRMCLFTEALLAIVRTVRAGLVCRRGVPQCTLSVAQAKRC